MRLHMNSRRIRSATLTCAILCATLAGCGGAEEQAAVSGFASSGDTTAQEQSQSSRAERSDAPAVDPQEAAAARDASIYANLRAIALATHHHHDAKRSLPPAAPRYTDAEAGKTSWRVYVLPFLDEEELFGEYRLEEAWDSEHNRRFLARIPAVFADPEHDDGDEGKTRIAFITGPETAWEKAPDRAAVGLGPTFAKITDGTSNTILAIRLPAEKAVPWTKPAEFVLNPDDPLDGLRPIPPEGLWCVMMDGAVYRIPADIKPSDFKTFCTHREGTFVDRDEVLREVRIEEPADDSDSDDERSPTVHNLKMIGLALHNHHDTYRSFPPVAPQYTFSDAGGTSWRVFVAPFLDAYELFKEYRRDEAWDSEHNKTFLERMPPAFAAPALDAADDGKTRIVLVTGPGTAWDKAPEEPGIGLGPKFSHFTDGSGNTIVAIELPADKAVRWTEPVDFVLNPDDPLDGLRPLPPEGLLCLTGDGAVHRIPADIKPEDFHALCTNAGGEIVLPAKVLAKP